MQEEEGAAAKPAQSAAGHISTSAASFRDFLLKPEILRAINDCAFEHPSKGTVPQDATCAYGRPPQVRRRAALRVPAAARTAWQFRRCEEGNGPRSRKQVVQGQTCWSGGLVPLGQWFGARAVGRRARLEGV
jgi:hypothetical protein